MAFFDYPLEELLEYLPRRTEPNDFEQFWIESLYETKAFELKPTFIKYDSYLKTLDVYDVSFGGYKGQRVKGWLILPRNTEGKLPCVVEYVGYGGGRGYPHDWLFWASAGYAHFVMDTRGQGSTWRIGETPDIDECGNPQFPGFMTKGILNKHTYYYRRVFLDAFRAIETVLHHPLVDSKNVVLTGGSQGGGITIAAAYLAMLSGIDIKLLLIDVPFLCHFKRALEVTDSFPYAEIKNFLKVHRDKENLVFDTLSYFDCVNFSAHLRYPALFSVALQDEICPPSTVFAAYNHYNGEKEIKIYPYNNHEGGESFHLLEKLRFLERKICNR